MALSIRQPWAWLVVNNIKDVENRTYSTNYRGRLFIHAGKVIVPEFDSVVEYLVATMESLKVDDSLIDDFVDWAFEAGSLARTPGVKEGFGAIVGEVNLVGWTPQRFSPWSDAGCIGWRFENARMYREPVPYAGRQKLFRVEFEMHEENVT